MNPVLFIMSLVLTGCTSIPVVKTVDRIVEIPVTTPCKIKQVDKPDMPTDKLKKEDSLDDKTAAALSEIERRKAYEKELEAAIKECQ
jgi:hypothetical protein